MSIVDSLRLTYKSEKSRLGGSEIEPNALLDRVWSLHMDYSNEGIISTELVGDQFPSLVRAKDSWTYPGMRSLSRWRRTSGSHNPVLDRIPADLLAELYSTIEHAFESAEVDEDLWGPKPTLDELGNAALQRLSYRASLRKAAEAESISIRQLAKIWNSSTAPIRLAVRNGMIVAIFSAERRQWFVPAWQFDEDWRPLTGLSDVVAAYPGGSAALTRWMNLPHFELEGRSPLEALKDGEFESVASLAARVNRTF